MWPSGGRGCSISVVGVAILICGVVCQVIQLVVSILRRDELRDNTGDPWDGRTLEWATSSPPPVFNFAVLPQVQDAEHYWELKQRAFEQAAPVGGAQLRTDRNAAQ